MLTTIATHGDPPPAAQRALARHALDHDLTDLAAALATREGLHPSAAQLLLQSREEGVRKALAENSSVDPDVLAEAFSNERRLPVLGAAAGRSVVSDALLQVLLRRRHVRVAVTLIGRQDLPSEAVQPVADLLLQHLDAGRKSYPTRNDIRTALRNSPHRHLIAALPSCPPATIVACLDSKMPEEVAVRVLHRAADAIEQLEFSGGHEHNTELKTWSETAIEIVRRVEVTDEVLHRLMEVTDRFAKQSIVMRLRKTVGAHIRVTPPLPAISTASGPELASAIEAAYASPKTTVVQAAAAEVWLHPEASAEQLDEAFLRLDEAVIGRLIDTMQQREGTDRLSYLLTAYTYSVLTRRQGLTVLAERDHSPSKALTEAFTRAAAAIDDVDLVGKLAIALGAPALLAPAELGLTLQRGSVLRYHADRVSGQLTAAVTPELGDDDATWAAFVSLAGEFNGSVAELAGTAAALSS